MRKWLVLILGVFSACHHDFEVLQPVENDDRTASWTEQERILIGNNNLLGFNLFEQVIITEKSNNVFISPLSVAVALTMTCNGAAGETEQAIKKVLGYPDTPMLQINETMQHIMRRLISADDKVAVSSANSIWYRRDKVILPQFINANQSYFSALVQSLDLSSPQAVPTINAWVNDNSNGRIPFIIDQIEGNTVMLLLNALCFKGIWSYTFDKTKTTLLPFHQADGAQIVCPMMNQTATLLYFENETVQAVELPYGNGAFTMTIYLPKPGVSVDAAVLRRTQEAVFVKQDGSLLLPKFKMNYEILLNEVLQRMGMAIAFIPGKADFSKMCAGDLFIDKVKQKSFIQVDEEGAEAAAVTVVVIKERSGGAGGFSMIVDRPFYFTIQEKSSNTVLFAGKVVEPMWN